MSKKELALYNKAVELYYSDVKSEYYSEACVSFLLALSEKDLFTVYKLVIKNEINGSLEALEYLDEGYSGLATTIESIAFENGFYSIKGKHFSKKRGNYNV